jgi:hypothetical protein
MKASVLIFLMAASLANAGTAVEVADESNAPFPNVLVIVRAANGAAEVGRFLTDAAGRTPALRFGPGLHQIILTCPYGLCATSVTEVVGETVGEVVRLVAAVRAIGEYGHIVGARDVPLTVLSSSSQPVAGLSFLVRNGDATRQKWYVTDAEGRSRIALADAVTVAVIVSRGQVYRYLLSTECGSGRAISADAYVGCAPVDREIVLTLPRAGR